MQNKAVFLDRDGVINKTIFRMGKARAPYSLRELELFDGVIESVKKIKAKGYLTIIVTNQPDVARGWVEENKVHLVNNRIKELIPIDEIRICFHTESDQCLCRKPRPGMLLAAAQKWNIDLSQSFMFGDRMSDVEAGKSAGCKTILVGSGDGPLTPTPDKQVKSLADGIAWILSTDQETGA